MRLAVVLPSRGLVFSETMAEVIREVRGAGCEWELFMAHSRPIPECFNEPVNEAIRWGATHVWMVEEDMALPAGILLELIDAIWEHPVVSADYPVAGGRIMCVNRDKAGKVRHTGTGCLLAEVETLKTVLPFRTDIAYRVTGDVWEPFIVPKNLAKVSYGMHDIHFGMILHGRGTPIHVIPTRCTQRVVVREATPKRNDHGWHDIELLPFPT